MRNFIFALLLTIPNYAFANKAIVRAGEHAGFSRITIQFSVSTPWSVGKINQGYEVRLEQPLSAFDASEVYKRLSRNRIPKILISDDKKRIILNTDCNCFADAFEFRPGLLVIDIKDGQAPQGSMFEKSFVSDETSSPVEQQNKSNVPVGVTPDTNIVEQDDKPIGNQVITLPVVTPRLAPNHQRSESQNKAQAHITTGGIISGVTLPHIPSSPDARLQQMQSIMFNQVSRAASQGLLQANTLKRVPTLHHERVEQNHDDKEPNITNSKQDAPTDHINMHVQSSIDSAIEKSRPQRPLSDNDETCYSNSILNISSWGNPDSILSEVSKQTALAIGEFDKINEQAVENLAKAFLYAGFGAEAKNVLTAFGTAPEHAGALKIMADTIDHNPLANPNLFTEQLECDTDVALWAILAQNEIPTGAKINTNAVLMAFSKLPAHLRLYLGPDLSQKFLKFDDIKTAQSLRDIIFRTPGLERPEFLLLNAKLDRTRGHDASATHRLKQIISEDTEVSPAALLELLEAQLESDTNADSHLLTVAETYIYEQQDTKIGADLLRILTLSTAKSGDLTKALDLLSEAEHSVHYDSSEKSKLWEDVLRYSLAEDADGKLVKFIFSAKEHISNHSISREIRRELSERLLTIGLPKVAQDLLKAPISPAIKDRIILAKVALSDRKPARSISLLKGIKTKEAVLIRAQAFAISNKYYQASLEYDKLSDVDLAQREIWKAGRWDELNAEVSETNKAVKRIMRLVTPMPDKSFSGTISADKALLNDSETVRETIESLLNEYPISTLTGS